MLLGAEEAFKPTNIYELYVGDTTTPQCQCMGGSLGRYLSLALNIPRKPMM